MTAVVSQMTRSLSSMIFGTGVRLLGSRGEDRVVAFGFAKVSHMAASVAPVAGRVSLVLQSRTVPRVKGFEEVAVSTHEKFELRTDSGVILLGSSSMSLSVTDRNFVTFECVVCLFLVVLCRFFVGVSFGKVVPV